MAWSRAPFWKVPTAMQSDAETQETAENWLGLSPWLGDGVPDHLDGAASACPAGSATVSSTATSTLLPRAIQRLNVLLPPAMPITVRTVPLASLCPPLSIVADAFQRQVWSAGAASWGDPRPGAP